MGIEIIMTALLGYQVFMPAADNGHYQFIKDESGYVRMNTQNGEMVRCDKDLKCPTEKK